MTIASMKTWFERSLRRSLKRWPSVLTWQTSRRVVKRLGYIMMLLFLFPTDQFTSQNDSDNSDSEKGQTEDEVRLTSAWIYKYSQFTSKTVHNCQTWKLHSQRSGTTLWRNIRGMTMMASHTVTTMEVLCGWLCFWSRNGPEQLYVLFHQIIFW